VLVMRDESGGEADVNTREKKLQNSFVLFCFGPSNRSFLQINRMEVLAFWSGIKRGRSASDSQVDPCICSGQPKKGHKRADS
jgi:hypothetical protein